MKNKQNDDWNYINLYVKTMIYYFYPGIVFLWKVAWNSAINSVQ